MSTNRGKEWSRHSDLNRGPAVYEPDRPKRCGPSVEWRVGCSASRSSFRARIPGAQPPEDARAHRHPTSPTTGRRNPSSCPNAAGRGASCLRLLEHRVATDPPPLHAERTVDLHELECCPTVRAGEAPGHLPDPRRALDVPDPERRGPLRGRVLRIPVAGGNEVPEGITEELPLPIREPPDVALEAPGRPELHRRLVERCSRRPSRPSTVVVRPAAMSASASRSSCCQRSDQNHA